MKRSCCTYGLIVDVAAPFWSLYEIYLCVTELINFRSGEYTKKVITEAHAYFSKFAGNTESHMRVASFFTREFAPVAMPRIVCMSR